MNESFRKTEKLKSKTLIDELFVRGKSIKSFPLTLVYLQTDKKYDTALQTGVSVPKKLFKNAVDRNRIKRMMREVFRKNKYLVTKELASSYAFMFIYIARDKLSYETLNTSMRKVMEKFMEKHLDHEKTNN